MKSYNKSFNINRWWWMMMRFFLLQLLSAVSSLARLKWTKIKSDNRYPASAVKMDGSIWVPQNCARIMFFHLSISVDLGASKTIQLSLPKTTPLFHDNDEQPTRWSGTKTHPYDDTAASKVPPQYEFTAVWRSALDSKAVTVGWVVGVEVGAGVSGQVVSPHPQFAK